MANGEWRTHLDSLVNKSVASVVPQTSHLSSEQRASVMVDFANGKNAMLMFLEAKFAFYSKLPYSLLGVAH
eukprot:13209000-Alexandrium_andersonii.AAC.1